MPKTRGESIFFTAWMMVYAMTLQYCSCNGKFFEYHILHYFEGNVDRIYHHCITDILCLR